MIPRPPIPTLFPYTTLFRSRPWRSNRCNRTGNWVETENAICRRSAAGERSANTIDVRSASVGQHTARHVIHEVIRSRFRSRSEEHTSELQSHSDLVCRLLLE